ncbi:MAG: histidine kinase [Alphaproteobacteria bacterium]|nr:histidine kinase [Alphaproteobacteria bacterium]
MRLNSLAFRLFITSAIWTLMVLPIAGFIIYGLYRTDVQATFDGRLEKLVNAVAVDAMAGEGGLPSVPPNRYEPLFEEIHSGWYWQIQPLNEQDTGRRLVSQSLATGQLPSPKVDGVKISETGSRWLNFDGPLGVRIRIVEVIDRVGHKKDGIPYSIAVAGPVDWLESQLATFRTRLATALTLAGLGLVVVTLFQVRFGLLPLRKIEQGLSDIRTGAATNLEGDFPVEIEPLQHELNALIRSNQDIVDRARTQVGNLAHALKTPLAVVTNEARDAKGTLAKKVTEQATIMRDQVSHYLDRARMAARSGVIGGASNVADVVAPLVRALERIHQDRGIKIQVTCPDDVLFQGEKQDLEEMLGNLLDNACKWAESTVYLTVDRSGEASGQSRTPGRLHIQVEDDGPGLNKEQRKRIGKRGMRLDESKPGSGLGLSIVTDLVQTYRGSFLLDQSEHGGLLVRLVLPAI